MTNKHINVALFVPHAGCPHRCSFCDQHAISGHTLPPTAQEITSACETALATRRTDAAHAEIAFFGGSFTALSTDEQEYLLRAAYPFVKSGQFRGIRVSTRPDCVDARTMALLTRYGVIAVELGAQSMQDAVLDANFRGHTAADVVRASRCIHETGVELGLQMMTGLYGDTADGARDTARQLCDLHPATLRIYPTQVMAHTALAAWWEQGVYIPPTLDETVDLCAQLLRYAECERGVRVIRLGLHADVSMMAHRLAGAYHPAFRELCESRLYLEEARRTLRCVYPHGGAATLWVAPTALSKMIGQKRQNLAALADEGYTVTIQTDAHIPRYAVWLQQDREVNV